DLLVLVTLLSAGDLSLGMPARLELAFLFKYWIVSQPPTYHQNTQMSNLIKERHRAKEACLASSERKRDVTYRGS
ncbi:MAG: hypothetical protein ACK56F_31080, partial [bacterium]